MPQMDLDFKKISSADRLASNEKKKDGIYKGQKSGRTSEMENINSYKQKHSGKYEKETQYYHDILSGKESSPHITWLEILFGPVPYDAINATPETTALIPSIRGLNSSGVNINGVNHHTATLGHDPILGWIFGTLNILSRKITLVNLMTFNVVKESTQLDRWRQSIDYTPKTNVLDMVQYCAESIKEDPNRLPAAIARQAMHLQSDKLTKEGLPIPLLSSLSPQKAQQLINKGWNSNEVERLMTKAAKDMEIVGAQALICMLINLIIKAIYLFCADTEDEAELHLREVRANKILLISNMMASSSNILYVAISHNLGKLDVGGIAVTLYNLIHNKDFIRNMKQEFICNELTREITGNSEWENYYYWEGTKDE